MGLHFGCRSYRVCAAHAVAGLRTAAAWVQVFHCFEAQDLSTAHCNIACLKNRNKVLGVL